MNVVAAYTILNILWFGVFVFAVFNLHWTPWALAVPCLFHFTVKDLQGKEDDDD